MRYHDPRHHFEFLGYLDRNLYSRISALAQPRSFRPEELPHFRWAAAVLAFSQIAEITFDYASSIYELASAQGGDRAVSEIHRFRTVDNSDPRLFIDFALGKTNQISSGSLAHVSPGKAVDPDEFEKRTTEFRLNYIFGLKIAQLTQLPGSGADKMVAFIDWMAEEFMFGAPALLFGNRYFSPGRFGRMIKGFSMKEIKNAAWDMTFVQNWRRSALKGLETNRPAILMSGDKAVRDIARRITAESHEEFFEYLQQPWGRGSKEGLRIFNHYRKTWDATEKDGARARRIPDYDAQLRIIESLEAAVIPR
jgi:hypothetical protein